MIDKNILKYRTAACGDPPELLGRPEEVFATVMEFAAPPRFSLGHDVRNKCGRIPRLLQFHIPHHVARNLYWRTRGVFPGENAIHLYGRQNKTSVLRIFPSDLKFIESGAKVDSAFRGNVTHTRYSLSGRLRTI